MEVRQAVIFTLMALRDEGHPIIFEYQDEKDMQRLIDKVNKCGDAVDGLIAE